MSKKDDRDLERPHYYSQYWINVARQAAGLSVAEDFEDFSTSDPDLITDSLSPLGIRTGSTIVDNTMDELDDITLPVPTVAPKPQKPRLPSRPPSLSSFADLAALGFGPDTETEELPVGIDDDEAAIVSRLESEFDMGNVEPDEEEAASLESLAEEDEDYWSEEEEDDDMPRRRTIIPPARPPRRPTRRREF
jgi:hypothetical protein